MTDDEWLSKRTFRGGDVDPERLVYLKRRQGVRVSVCLPTLNVAETVGPIVTAVREMWAGAGGLVDEIAVIDSRSGDATVARARDAGASVYYDDAILPELGPGYGKGEALWKSLAVLSGDIVVWLDSDVVDFDPAFVPGILAPLWADGDIAYVKAMYRRRLGDSDDGGRVTEICARPLINLFYPELAVISQPLSGEAAGRRGLLESLPFFSGYAVELGLLIDVYRRAGMTALAQVDLGERRHTNQPTPALGEMAYAISQAVLWRLADEGRVPDELAAEPGPYRRPVAGPDGRLTLDSRAVRPAQRPAAATVPGYRNRAVARATPPHGQGQAST